MYNKDKVDELCFELNTELKSDYDIDNIKIKLAELLSVVLPFDENIFKNSQYLSLIKKLTKIKELNNELNSLFISILPVNKNKYLKENKKTELLKLSLEYSEKHVLRYLLKNSIDDLYEMIMNDINNNYPNNNNVVYLDNLYKALKIKSRTLNIENLIENFNKNLVLSRHNNFANFKLYLLNKITNKEINQKQKQQLLITTLTTRQTILIEKVLTIKNIPENVIIASILDEIEDLKSILLVFFIGKQNEELSIIRKLMDCLSKEGIYKLESAFKNKISVNNTSVLNRVETDFVILIEKIKLEIELKNF